MVQTTREERLILLIFSHPISNLFPPFFPITLSDTCLTYHVSSPVYIQACGSSKSGKSLHLSLQLAMKDQSDVRQTFLYKLSQEQGLEHFQNVLLCGSSQDNYVPIHSAHMELCLAAISDSSSSGQYFLSFICLSLVSRFNPVNAFCSSD